MRNDGYKPNELAKLVYSGLKERTNKQTIEEIARDFIIENCYRTDTWGSLKLIPKNGWIVLELPPDKRPNPTISFETFHEEDDAISHAKVLYPNANEDWLNQICYSGIIGFDKQTGSGKRKAALKQDEEDRLQQMVEENKQRVEDKIRKFLIKHGDPNALPYFNHPSPESAENAYLKIVMRNNEDRGKALLRLRSDKTGNGQWFTLDEKQWSQDKREKGKRAPDYPKVPEVVEKVGEVIYDEIGFLIHFYEYLYNRNEVTIAEALSIGHKAIYTNYEGAKAKRSSLNGQDVISISQDSNFKETIFSMATKGFDMQPIIDFKGTCVGAIKLQDVLNFISRKGVRSLPSNFNLEILEKENLLLPIPPLLDARSPVSEAEKILQSGSDGILIRFESNNWIGECPKIVSETLSEGLHIVTSHDIIAFNLTK